MEPADWLAIGLLLTIVTMSIQATIIVHLIHFLDAIRAELTRGIPGGPKVDHIGIFFLETDMAAVVEGASVTFVVQGFNKKGNQVPLTDATVTTVDGAVATATVSSDGTGGVLSGVAVGATELDAAAAGKAASEPVTVTADPVVDSLKIVFGTP